MAFGGSTNAVLHLLAIAHEAARRRSTLDDFTPRSATRVPHLADVKPFGQYVMTDVDRVGGVPVVMRALLDAGLLHGDVLTVTGKTMAENLADIAPPDVDGKVLRAMSEPIHRTGGITILRGSLAPDGAVVKTAGFDDDVFEGIARVFDGERAAMDAVSRRHASRPATSSSSATRDPRVARACARCSPSPARSRAPGSARTCCCSPTAGSRGGTTGLCVGHVAPEACDGGPIALVRDGDRIRLDVAAHRLDLLVDDDELAARRSGWAPLPPVYRTGVLAKYVKLVGSAAGGAVCG